MEFKNVILQNISKLSMEDLLQIKAAIDEHLGGDSLEVVATKIKREEGMLRATKYVKDRMGWGLKESKEYVDALTPSRIMVETVQEMLTAEKRLDAIKYVNDATKWGLKESKEFVDKYL